MKIKKEFFLLITALTLQSGFAQKDGYWDKTRATTAEITVSARDRIRDRGHPTDE